MYSWLKSQWRVTPSHRCHVQPNVAQPFFDKGFPNCCILETILSSWGRQLKLAQSINQLDKVCPNERSYTFLDRDKKGII